MPVHETIERFGATTEVTYRLDTCSSTTGKLEVRLHQVRLVRQTASTDSGGPWPDAPAPPFMGLSPIIIVDPQGHFEAVVLSVVSGAPEVPPVEVSEALATRWKSWAERWLFYGESGITEVRRQEEWGAGWGHGNFFTPATPSHPAVLGSYFLLAREGGLSEKLTLIPPEVLRLGISEDDVSSVAKGWVTHSTWPGLFPRLVTSDERTVVRIDGSERRLVQTYRAEFDWDKARRAHCSSTQGEDAFDNWGGSRGGAATDKTLTVAPDRSNEATREKVWSTSSSTGRPLVLHG